MTAQGQALKERKKGPFLRAFLRVGKIGRAAAQVHVSRDAVHDWRRSDPVFAKAFEVARETFRTADNSQLQDHAEFLLREIRSTIPAELWPAVTATIALAIANRRFRTHFKEQALRPAPSRTVTEVNRAEQNGQVMASPGPSASDLRSPFSTGEMAMG